MRFHWLLPSTLSVFLLSSPAEAAKLKSWHFDAKQNRLELKTDAKVQPTAQLIFNPTRLVIDLPGTTLERTTVKQEVGGAIRSLRVGQFDDQTTRVVIELSPGYRLDPQQVKFSGASLASGRYSYRHLKERYLTRPVRFHRLAHLVMPHRLARVWMNGADPLPQGQSFQSLHLLVAPKIPDHRP